MKRMIRIRRIAAAALCMVILAAGAVHSQYYLGVVQGESRKIPLLVFEIANGTGSGKLTGLTLEVLQADLRRTQIFEVLDPRKLDVPYVSLTEPPQPVLKRAGTFGATGAVWVSLQKKGNELVLSGRLYDAASGMKMAGKEYFGNEETLRRMVHSFADEIVSRFTGEKGIARTRIAFVSDKTKFKELYVMDYDGQNQRKVTADRSICLSPAWSPDGKILAYVSYRDRNPDLYGLNMETGKRWKISGSEGLNISPAWSPNGKRLAAALSKDGSAEVYLMDQNGGELERLTYGAWDNVSPSWAPNGREIAFTSGRAGTPQIYIMNSDGTDVRRVTFEGGYNASPHWSSRGDRLVFVSQMRGLFKIATVNPDGSDLRIITSGPGNDENPSWSPSGRQIVFSSNRSGRSGIYIMNADGSGLERLTPDDANYSSPAWSP